MRSDDGDGTTQRYYDSINSMSHGEEDDGDELVIDASEHLNLRDAVRVMSASERMEALQALLDRFEDATGGDAVCVSEDEDPWLDSKMLVMSLITDW